MTNLALVGAAHIHTPNFIERLGRRDDVRVTRVWDHDEARARRAADALSAAPSSLDEIWHDAAVGAVIVASETDLHEELVTPAAAAGKHLFVEKPLGLAGADAYRMAHAIEGAGVLFQTGYFMRGQSLHRFLKTHIDEGHFGTLTRVRHVNCHAGSLGGWFDREWRWMADPTRAGVGAFGDLGTHSLDILLWLLGEREGEVGAATASIRSVTGRYGDCDESGEGMLRFASGAVATLAAGWVDVANPVTAVVSGTEGHAHVVNGQLYFKSEHVDGADGVEPWTDLPPTLPHAFELFLDALAGADVALVAPREAAYRNAVMEALYRGAEAGRWLEPVVG